MSKKMIARIVTKFVTMAGVAGLGIALSGAPAMAQQEFGSPELIAAAKAEGKLVYYTANFAEVEQQVIKAFNKRFPEIKVEMVRAPGGQLITRVKTEAAAGKLIADVVDHSDRALMAELVDMFQDYAPPNIRRCIILEHVDQLCHQRAVGMIDHVGDQLAGRGLGLDAGDELAARRAHHLNLDLGKALVERLDDLLFDLGEVRGVIDQLAFRFRRRDQFGRAEFLLGHSRCAAQGDAETGDAGHGDELGDDPGDHFFAHSQSSLGSIYPVRATLP